MREPEPRLVDHADGEVPHRRVQHLHRVVGAVVRDDDELPVHVRRHPGAGEAGERLL